MLPARCPNPSALQEEFSFQSNNKLWGGSGSGSSVTVAVAAASSTTAAAGSGTPPLPLQSSQPGVQIINSSASSGSSSPNSSPKSATATNPPTITTANTLTTTTATTASVQAGRSLASAINPRSLLSSFTSTSVQKQQHLQLNSATSPVTPTFPPLIVTNNNNSPFSTTVTSVPISPRPIKPAGPRTGFLTGSLSTSKLSNVLGGGSNRSNDVNSGTSDRGGVYEEEERLEVTLEYQLQQHHQHHPQFNPHRKASTTSTVGSGKYSGLPSPDAMALYREHHQQHPFAMSGANGGLDYFQQQLSPQPQAFHPMWQMGSSGSGNAAGTRSGSASGDGLMMARDFNGRRSIDRSSGGGVMMVKEDLLDPVTSAAADAMEGFDREA